MNAVSEGIRTAEGVYVGEGTQSGATDAFGHKYLSGTGKALEIADRAYVLETGNITLSGTGKELAQSDEIRKAYLGG